MAIKDSERLAVLEVRVNDHEEDLKHMQKNQELLREGIAGIQTTLQRILFVIVGAVSILVLQEQGLFKAFFLLIK